ncbi:MAG TPA: MATE family efflux transporter, partial [Dielma fastidiosa]|nr:MATE family efflux transporter [Dielma fastidiosa]
MKKFMTKYFGDRHFYKEVLIVAVPLMLQSLITTSINLVDNLMVGQLGDAAIGGVAAVNRFYMIGMFGTNGMITAAGIFIAQFFGARDKEHMQQSFRFSI